MSKHYDDRPVPPCPWCYADAQERGDSCEVLVERVPARVSPRKYDQPWAFGGWRCRFCEVEAPALAWAQALLWAAEKYGDFALFDEDEVQLNEADEPGDTSEWPGQLYPILHSVEIAWRGPREPNPPVESLTYFDP